MDCGVSSKLAHKTRPVTERPRSYLRHPHLSAIAFVESWGRLFTITGDRDRSAIASTLKATAVLACNSYPCADCAGLLVKLPTIAVNNEVAEAVCASACDC